MGRNFNLLSDSSMFYTYKEFYDIYIFCGKIVIYLIINIFLYTSSWCKQPQKGI
jgi:hypothetical protein